jgi:hypothetical protein
VAPRRPSDAGLSAPARRALLAAVVAVPACGALPQGAAPAGTVPAPAVRVGDRWRYLLTERSRGRWLDEPTFEVVEVAPEIRIAVSSRRGGPPGEERFASAWTALVETLYGLSYAFAAPVPLVPSPIGAGFGATATTYRDPGTGRRRRWTQQLTGGGWTRVQVPAGEFECLRIGRVVAFDHPDDNRRSATMTDTLWYAPQVNRWVQRTWQGEYISAGLSGADNPPEGTQGRDDWLLWQLTAYVPAPGAR